MSETLWTLYEQGQLNKNVYHSISNDSYHNGPGISSSQIKKAINQSAGHALFKSESKTTPAMAFGTAFHTYAMEPEKFNASSIKPADFEIILKMTNNLFSHKLASEIMFDSQHELSFYSKHQETGLLLKARVDGINKKNVIWDLKTCNSASKPDFTYDARYYDYAISAAHYLNVCGSVLDEVLTDFYLIACEKVAPYQVAVYKVSATSLFAANQKIDKALKDLKSQYENPKSFQFDTIQEIDI